MIPLVNVSLHWVDINPFILLTTLGLSVAKRAKAAGLDEISTELTNITLMDDDEGIQYYNANLERIGRWPHHLGTKWSLTFPVVWWKESIRKKSRVLVASKSLWHAALINR